EWLAAEDGRTWALMEATAAALGPALDELHGTDEGAGYWRVLLEPWLLIAVSVLTDRALFVRTIRALAPDAPLLAAAELAPPATMAEAVARFRSDRGNRDLITRLAAAA